MESYFLYSSLTSLEEKIHYWDFPGGPVVKNLPSNGGDNGSIPGGQTKVPHASGQLSLCTELCNEDPVQSKIKTTTPTTTTKTLLSLPIYQFCLKFAFFFFPFLWHTLRAELPWPDIETVLPSLEAWRLNPWTSREVPNFSFSSRKKTRQWYLTRG